MKEKEKECLIPPLSPVSPVMSLENFISELRNLRIGFVLAPTGEVEFSASGAVPEAVKAAARAWKQELIWLIRRRLSVDEARGREPWEAWLSATAAQEWWAIKQQARRQLGATCERCGVRLWAPGAGVDAMKRAMAFFGSHGWEWSKFGGWRCGYCSSK